MGYNFKFCLLVVFLVSCNSQSILRKDINILNERIIRIETLFKKKLVFDQKQAYKIPVKNSFYLGNKESKTILTIFIDIQCPFCKEINKFIKQILRDKNLKNKFKIIFKHFPLSFHKSSNNAAIASIAAGEQGNKYFWEIVNIMFDNQCDLTDTNFIKWAKDITQEYPFFNFKKFKKDVVNNKNRYKNKIKEDMGLGLKTGIRGIPTLMVNGWSFNGRTVSAFKKFLKLKKVTDCYS